MSYEFIYIISIELMILQKGDWISSPSPGGRGLGRGDILLFL